MQYYKYNGEPYCDGCYKKKAQVCAKCKKDIVGKIYSAINKTYHLECFVCDVCHRGFDDSSFISHNEQPHHKDCYRHKFIKFCMYCKDEIWGEYLYVEGGVDC